MRENPWRQSIKTQKQKQTRHDIYECVRRILQHIAWHYIALHDATLHNVLHHHMAPLRYRHIPSLLHFFIAALPHYHRSSTCMHARMHACIHSCLHAYIYIYETCMHANIHAEIRADVGKYRHTYMQDANVIYPMLRLQPRQPRRPRQA